MHAIKALYDEASTLDVVPNLGLADEQLLFHIEGFDFGGGFYVTDCYVTANDSAANDLSVNVITVNMAGRSQSISYQHRGDILYEVLQPAAVLW